MSPAQLKKMKPVGNVSSTFGTNRVSSATHAFIQQKHSRVVDCSTVQVHPWTLKTSLKSNKEGHLHDSFPLREEAS